MVLCCGGVLLEGVVRCEIDSVFDIGGILHKSMRCVCNFGESTISR